MTTPKLETAAIAGFVDDQLAFLPVSVLPFASEAMAMRGVISPTSSFATPGSLRTLTASTIADVTTILAVPLAPSAVARIVDNPPARLAVATPVADTDATLSSLLPHTIGLSTGSPALSKTKAISCVCSPINRDAVPGLTSMRPAGRNIPALSQAVMGYSSAAMSLSKPASS